jgi:hypothetical protein
VINFEDLLDALVSAVEVRCAADAENEGEYSQRTRDALDKASEAEHAAREAILTALNGGA